MNNDKYQKLRDAVSKNPSFTGNGRYKDIRIRAIDCENLGFGVVFAMPADADGKSVAKANAELISAVFDVDTIRALLAELDAKTAALESCIYYGSMTGDDWVLKKAQKALES